MSRNHLKSFPTAMLRRGMAHFSPMSPPNVVILAADPVERDPASSRAPRTPLAPEEIRVLDESA
jgi:hypothetical protein